MLKELQLLKPFFNDPNRSYSAREISKNCEISHVTIGKYLKEYSFIKRASYGPYLGFKAEQNEEFLQLKLFYNLETIRESKIIQQISKFYDYPTIVLFGSFATATNTAKSDIDLFIISTHKKEMNLNDKIFNHDLHLLIYTKKDVDKMKKDNPNLLNSICNGIVLQGELEVFI